jgi:hypothetical protein
MWGSEVSYFFFRMEGQSTDVRVLQAIVKIYHRAPHGFIRYPLGTTKAVQETLDDTKVFMKAKLEK